MRAAAIAWKEMIQLRRDRLTLAMMAVLPVLQLLLFGYAIATDVRDLPLAVYDQDRSRASRDLASRLQATGYFEIVGQLGGQAAVERSLRTAAARAVLVVPPDFGSDLAAGRPAVAQLVLDGSDPQAVSSAVDTATALASRMAFEELGAGRAAVPLSIEPNIFYNPELRIAVAVVPGLIGVILTMTMVMLTSMAMARERERGTLEQLIVTPVRRWELVVGKIVPYVAIGAVQMALILGLGKVVFDVPIVGSLVTLFLLAFVFILANLALGLLFSSVARTQQQAMQMSVFFLLPNILLSGFMFPFEAMPEAAQWLAQLLPLTHFMRIVRGVVLKGAAAGELLPELFWLSGILAVLLTASALRFTKKLQ